jgi:hypothetical protein
MNALNENLNERNLLRFITAGSVDDGKSTLIGRLLFDSKGIFADQLAAVSRAKHKRTVGDTIDLSLLTDGLKPNVSRASPSTSPTAISPRRSASSSSPIRRATSSTRAIW